MERIQIGGVWYRLEREERAIESIENEIAKYQAYVYETREFCFEATRLYRDRGEELDKDFSIELTDKRTGKWTTDYWDSMPWFEAVYLGNEELVANLKKQIGEVGFEQTRRFLGYLRSNGWL